MRASSSVEAAIVCGAGRGIGRAVALGLAHEGIHVLCISKTENADVTRKHIESEGGSAASMQLDVSQYHTTAKSVGEWLEGSSYKRIGVVLAAATLGPQGPLAATSLGEWDETFRVNVLGNLAVVQACLTPMLKSGFGRILFFAGGGAAYAYPHFPAYAMSKTALVRIVENLHEDLKGAGDFSVVCVAPGAVQTDLLDQVRATGAEVRTVASADESVRFAVAFFAKDSRLLSGRFIHVLDDWARLLDEGEELPEDVWKLRRAE